MMSASLRCLAVTALVVVLFPALTRADDKTPAGAEKSRRQLDGPVTLELTDQSLSTALKHLRERADLNLVVDRTGMTQAGLDPEQLLVSVSLKDVKAKSALRALLAQHNLGYAIVGDTILVSTDELVMQRQLKQRVSVDMEKLDLAAALKQLSKDTGANVVLDSKIPEKARETAVSLQMDDVPLETAVKLLADAGGLKPVKVGNVYLVTTKARANEILSDPEHQPVPKQQQVMYEDFLGNVAFNPRGGMVWMGRGGMMWGGFNGGLPGDGKVPPLEKPADKRDEPEPDPKSK